MMKSHKIDGRATFPITEMAIFLGNNKIGGRITFPIAEMTFFFLGITLKTSRCTDENNGNMQMVLMEIREGHFPLKPTLSFLKDKILIVRALKLEKGYASRKENKKEKKMAIGWPCNLFQKAKIEMNENQNRDI